MFKCPECGVDALVTNSKEDGVARRRWRRCQGCGNKFNTLEVVEPKRNRGRPVQMVEPADETFALSAWQVDFVDSRKPKGWRAKVESFCCEAMSKAWASDLVRFGADCDALHQGTPEVHIFDFDWEHGWPEPVRLPGEPIRFCPWCGGAVEIRRNGR